MPEPLSVGRCAQAMLAHVAGRFDEAERRYAEACAQMARHGSLHADGIATLATVTIRASQHRMADYAPAVQELDTRFGPLAADARAVALAAAGRPDAARAVLDGAPPLRPDFYFSIFATLRAMAVVAVGQRAPAEELYAALLPIRGQLAGAASTSLAMRPVAHPRRAGPAARPARGRRRASRGGGRGRPGVGGPAMGGRGTRRDGPGGAPWPHQPGQRVARPRLMLGPRPRLGWDPVAGQPGTTATQPIEIRRSRGRGTAMVIRAGGSSGKCSA
jgi:hypothetical protein